MEHSKEQKRYCIRGKHAIIICATIVVCALALGLGLGLGLKKTTSSNNQESTTSPPTEPTPADRGPCLPSTEDGGDWKNFRLPDYVKPTHYNLHLLPDMVDDTYTGTVDVHVEVSQATRHLWLHIRETFVSAAPRLKLVKANGEQQEVAVKRCFEYQTHQYVVTEAAQELAATQPGEVYVLSLDFQGWLNGSVVGFYRVVYTEGGETKKIAATDHEPTDARKSFPCFDEPNKKATYSISISHDKEYGALSNMPVERTVDGTKSTRTTYFKKSVPMSTYLVCFAVHKFESVGRTSKRGIPLRIFAQPSQLHTAEYAANVTKIIFDYFEEYFNMTYSISKLDKIAIPDFGTGAMENWGLITYRETNLLYDPEESSSINKQRVASVIAHELVHQWFGNIVTMDWWDDLWLNEGFASFFEYIGVEEAEKDWGMRDVMIINDVLPVMVDDALVTSHPIIVNVSTPAQITSVFDSISYSKGASILRMLEDWMGRDVFRDGCRKYLKDFEFTNAKTADFWASLASVSRLPVSEVMDTWTMQMGYPVLDLAMADAAKLTQERFLLDSTADPNDPVSPFEYKWTIPVKWHSVKSDKNEMTMFNKSTAEHHISNYSLSTDGLLKVNNDHMGFYRVNHDASTWAQISQQLQTNHVEFDAADRTSYIDDVFALARANLIDYSTALDLTTYLTNETEYIAWSRVSSSIAYVRDMLSSNAELFPKFQKVFRDYVRPISTRLGWTDTGSQTERLLRETVLGIACQMNDEEALTQASNLFDQWINSSDSKVAVNLRLLVYRYGMKKSGNAEKWEVMFQRYRQSSLAQEKDKLLYGLASVENVDLLSRLLEASKNESVVRSQDLFTLVRYVSYNPLGKSMAWDWTTLNWDYLVDRYTINDRNLGRLPSQITTTYNTDLQLWKMELFFKQTPDAGAGQMPRKQAVETVRNNIKWLNDNLDEITTWLRAKVPEA